MEKHKMEKQRLSKKSRRMIMGLLGIIIPVLVIIMIKTGVAAPHPDLKTAYLIAAAVGAVGLIQLIIALFE